MKSQSFSSPHTSTELPLHPLVAAHHHRVIGPLMEKWKNQGKVPSVLLLTGLSGIGKRALAFHVAQWLLCESSGFSSNTSLEPDLFGNKEESSTPKNFKVSFGPCQECSSCVKAIRGTWVDFREIGAPNDSSTPSEDEEPSAQFSKLKIDDFREIKSSLGFGAHEGIYRIFLISNAERMTSQASNSLLKLLEEPPASWIFILTSADSSLLLPTLVSRCQQIRLLPFDSSTLRALLKDAKVAQEKHEFCLQLGQGSWRRTMDASEDTIWERRLQVLKFLENPPEHLNSLVDWAAASVESMTLLLDLLEPIQLELLQSRLSSCTVTDTFLTGHLKYLAMRVRDPSHQRQFCLERCERLARARREVRLPLNKKLLVQEILLPYLLS